MLGVAALALRVQPERLARQGQPDLQGQRVQPGQPDPVLLAQPERLVPLVQWARPERQALRGLAQPEQRAPLGRQALQEPQGL